MSDTDHARLILEPIIDSPFVAPYVSDNEIRWSELMDSQRFQALSSGEQALVRIANAVWAWRSIHVSDLQALDPTTRGKTLAAIVRSMQVTEYVVHDLAVDLYGL